MDQKVLWTPNNSFRQKSNLVHYINWLGTNRNKHFDTYEELWTWSTDQIEEFWESLLEYFDIQYDGQYHHVVSSIEMPGVRWFEGIKLNYSEHLFRHAQEDKAALIFQNELGRQSITWKKLRHDAGCLRQYLKSIGVRRGDRVAAYLPNIPQAIIAFIAVNSLGAVWSCCSPDFGVETVIERFKQIEPKVLIAADGYQYAGKSFNRINEIGKIRSELPSVAQTIFIQYHDPSSKLADSIKWSKIMEQAGREPLRFKRVDFNDPIWVLYSSGTTGIPKAITHSHGGVLLEHLKYMSFHNDVKKDEMFFWFTTTGWMMWNFLQSSMLAGAIPVLYDGSPGYPNMEVLWKMAEDLPIHHFGTSAPYLAALMKKNLLIGENHNLSKLRSIGSTGAPLAPEVFEWIYNNIKGDLWLCSMSGGTDMCTAFVGGNPLAPVYKGAIQCRCLGCAMEAYDDQGQSVRESLGEMIIEKPMPCMPIYFWNDKYDARYRSSYFENYPGKWRHGDWIQIFKNGSLVIHGRSDATLNRKGIRIGTAEIYNVLDKIKGIKDSLVLNLEKPDGSDIMPLFIALDENEVLSESLINEIKSQLKSKCSPRHVPDKIIEVEDIPYTLSGKKMEVPVKKVFMKMDIKQSMNRDAMRNPEAMDEFIELANSLEI